MNIADFGFVPHVCATVAPGQRFGRITILEVGKDPRPGVYDYRAVYLCDCGNIRFAKLGSIQIGTTKSCGCLSQERATKHGLWKSPLYRVWRHMMFRCYDPADQAFSNYGGRGITVCEQWHELPRFHADMAPSYRAGLTLERRANALGYSPENCFWTTPAIQARNKRSNIRLTIEGREMVLKDWCLHFGIAYHTVYHRIKKMGWEPVRALTTPLTRTKRYA
jgi:hypothetical protein